MIGRMHNSSKPIGTRKWQQQSIRKEICDQCTACTWHALQSQLQHALHCFLTEAHVISPTALAAVLSGAEGLRKGESTTIHQVGVLEGVLERSALLCGSHADKYLIWAPHAWARSGISRRQTICIAEPIGEMRGASSAVSASKAIGQVQSLSLHSPNWGY